MTFKQSIITCLRKYFTFSGRASRSEYWWFFLFNVLGGAFFGAVEGFINGITDTPDGPTLLSGAFNLVLFIPSFAVGFRRMHDTGRSGLYLLYPLIAMVGLVTFITFASGFGTMQGSDPSALFEGVFGIIIGLAIVVVAISPLIVLFWLTRPSQPGQNQYGPNPTEVHP